MTLVVKECNYFGDRPHRNRQLTQQEWSGLGRCGPGWDLGVDTALLEFMKGSSVPGAVAGMEGCRGHCGVGGWGASRAAVAPFEGRGRWEDIMRSM